MNSIVKKLIDDSRKAFLLDGIGASMSAFFLGIVLVQFQELFGASVDLLIYLAVIALVMAIYSLTCYCCFPSRWQPFMKAIAIANLLYCTVTVILVLLGDEPLTILGYLYFIGEVLLIGCVAWVELKVAQS